MLDAWHYVLEAFQNCDRLTIGLTNVYHEWAIKLFENYKKKKRKRSCSLKIKASKVMLCFKDKTSDKSLC